MHSLLKQTEDYVISTSDCAGGPSAGATASYTNPKQSVRICGGCKRSETRCGSISYIGAANRNAAHRSANQRSIFLAGEAADGGGPRKADTGGRPRFNPGRHPPHCQRLDRRQPICPEESARARFV